jgi:DNA-binding PadR family transcriptional regulator
MYYYLFRYYVRQAVKKPDREITDLQKRILKHVCMRKNADYKTLSKATDRDRITLLQSLQSLIKHRLVEKENTSVDRRRIKLIFKPTDKGKIYASTSLGIDDDAIRNTQSDDNERMRYDEFIEQVPNPAERKRNDKRVKEDLLQENLFQDDGNIPDMDKLLNQLLRVRLLKFVKSRNFDINELFTPVGTNTLKAISAPGEIKEFKKLLILLRKNLDSTIKSLSND